MLHLLYLVAFTVIAFLAIGNLLRSLLAVSRDVRYSPMGRPPADKSQSPFRASRSRYNSVPHPELLDDTGNPINEPLLVMRSMSVDDARARLDALYDSSPGNPSEKREEG
ncbi:MAG TPA: DUF2973 domain-containing protein [Waterburya sp.]|jgi:hypothetical protein